MKRRWVGPAWASVLVVALVSAAATALESSAGALALPVVVASFLAGRCLRSLRTALVAFAVATAVVVTGSAVRGGADAWSPVLTLLLATSVEVVLPWWLGRSRRLRLEHADRERAVIADLARSSERARIAADMHDSLGHELALIALRSGALEMDPGATEQQRAAAAAVRTGSVAATERLHDIIGVLRADAGGSTSWPDDDVEELVSRSRAAGIDVQLNWSASAAEGPHSRSVRQIVHRVVQEAITNAAKHAPGSPVGVRIDLVADAVVVDVTSRLTAGARPAARGGGRGLTALDQRVRLLGGAVHAGPCGDGFHLRAEIPLDARADAHHRGADQRGSPAVRRLHRQRRASLGRTAVLPALLGVGLLTALLGVQAVTVWQTALHPDDYAALRLGQSRDRVSQLLPPDSQDEPPPVIVVPPAPPETTCQYFQARAGVLDLSQDMYRLCFRDDVLVSKDPLLPRRT